jgi:SPP1 family predicted phage head-tail adaptor
MPTRSVRRRRLKKYGIGDMRERITIHTRVITPPDFDGVSFTEEYDAGEEVWASVETIFKGESLFNSVNVPDNATHRFIIRFDDTTTSENIIRWEGDAYEILSVTDPDKRQQYLELPAKLLGDETLEANT